jgi:hypothetical protein
MSKYAMSIRLEAAVSTMTIKHQIREPQLCPECGYLLNFRADSAGQLVAYCEGCEIEIPVLLIPEAGSASGASKNALTKEA